MFLGIDLGGTKIEGAVLDGAGAFLARERVPTPQGDYEGTLDAIERLVAHLEERFALGGKRFGIGIPGSISPQSALERNANSTVLNGKPLLADLRRRFGERVTVANDANCFALSESRDGAGSGLDVVFGVILGTGVGGGIVIRNQLVTGRLGIAGEWGHTPLPWPRDDERPGPACYCGKTGCIETFLSGPGFERDYAAASGRSVRAAEIAELARAGDTFAEAALERYADRLARGLAVVINVLDPDAIVLGGGVSNIEAIYSRTRHKLATYVFSDIVTTPLARAKHGDSSGVRGAAWLGITPAAESKSSS